MIDISLDKPLSFVSLKDSEIETSRTYYIDWDSGRIHGFVDKVEAMKQFIKKALITPRFSCLIYNSQYGSEIEQNILDENADIEYIETEIPFLIEDALIHDERILRVYNINVEFGEEYPLINSVIVSCDVDTIYGKIPFREVV